MEFSCSSFLSYFFWLAYFFSRCNCQDIRNIYKINELTGSETVNITGFYSGNYDTVDLMWYSFQDIELNVVTFDIDTQSGDFIIISKYMLQWVKNEPRPRLPKVWEYILLAESEGFNSTIQLVNTAGAGIAVYFHGQLEPTRSIHQTGFNIEVSLIDKTEPIASTTPEPIISTPDPGIDVYTTKFVIGKTPAQFVNDIRPFRRTLAEMTNSYCKNKSIELQNDATEADISVPTSLLRFCSRSWPPYETCVEVTFAIAVYSKLNNEYVMTSTSILEMWKEYKSHFDLNDYEPTDDVFESTSIWITIFLGIILVTLPIISVVLLRKWNTEFKRDSGFINQIGTEQQDGWNVPNFADLNQPLNKAIINETFSYDNRAFLNEPIHRTNFAYTPDEDVHFSNTERIELNENPQIVDLEEINSRTTTSFMY